MSDTTDDFVEQAKKVLIGNYARLPTVMVRGQGHLLWDKRGKEYIDLFAGFGGTILGHCHPALIKAASDQAQQLWAVGNTFYTEAQVRLAEKIEKSAFPGRAFFCHSGLEANEAATKLGRLRHGGDGKKWKVVSLNKSFHGRSLAMVAATGNPAVKAGFDPQTPGFTQVDLGDMEGLTAAVDDQTATIMMEPIQGEGGIHELPLQYVAEVRKLCDAKGITLHYDEVWTGGGRTGKWYGHQHFLDAFGKVLQPDIMTLGKAVGGGLPVGIMWAKPELAKLLVPGKHGCTLGANPICMAVADAVYETIEKEGLLAHAAKLGDHAIMRLRGEKRLAGVVKDVRGRGLFLGLELTSEPKDLVQRGLDHGVVINLTQKNVVRIAPAINIPTAAWDEGLGRLVETLATLALS